MPVYEVEGKRYKLPDDLSEQETGEALEALYYKDNPQALPEEPSGNRPERLASDFPEAPQSETDKLSQILPFSPSIDPDTLAHDPDWLAATRLAYKLNEGKDWEGKDNELAEYGLDYMGWFNYNLPKMAYEAGQLQSAPQEQKEAFLYLMDTYDKLEMSWGGTGRFFKGVLSDPLTYTGLLTLGIGTAAGATAKQATKQGVKALLKKSLGRTGVITGIEGGLYAGADNTIRQSVEVTAGRKKEIDGVESTIATGAGVLFAMAGGTAADAIATKISQFFKGSGDIVPTLGKKEAATGSAEVSLNEIKQSINPSKEALQGSPPKKSKNKVNQLNTPHLKTPVPFESVSVEEQKRLAAQIAEDLAESSPAEVEKLLDDLKTAKLSAKDWNRFKTAVISARDDVAKEAYELSKRIKETSNPEKQRQLYAEFEEVYSRLGNLTKLDEPLASDTGQALGIRKGRLDLKDLDLNDMDAFAKAMDRLEESDQVKRVKSSYDQKIKEAEDSSDWAEASRLKVMRSLETEDELSRIVNGDTLPDSKVKRGFMKLNELAISNVFSATTVAINLIPSGIKTVIRPAMDALLSDPLQAATRRKMMTTYSTMFNSIGSAAQAAKAAFRYEQSVLTREAGRLMEGELALGGGKLSGRVAGKVRFFPRVLNMTDEFLGQVAYRGFIAGEMTMDALEKGMKEGLTGKKLDTYIKKEVKSELISAFGDVHSDEALRTVVNKGRNLGYRDEQLAHYVKTEVARSGDALKHGKNKEGLDYVRDLLYKRQFSGKGYASKMARKYEEFVNEQPYMRILGQLFFRTPVRVFEEGIRLTPAIQILAPNFMTDLMGKNGVRAQVKAKGEALASFAITGWVLKEYAQGNLTGDGAYDHWKQQRARTDSDLPEPYTLKDKDGGTWSYRNFDPFATPVKIITNALERFEDLSMRERQGEFIDKKAKDKALGAVTVATMAIATSIRDANLMGGVQEGLKLMDYLANPEDNENGGLKFIASKLKLLVPNTLHKIAKTNDPTIDDPATFWQMIQTQLLGGASLGFYDKSSPKSYDIMGNVRRINDTGMLWNIFSKSTPEERRKGLSETELRVMRSLDSISKQTGTTFAFPNKHSMLPDVDLRTRYTKDGKETLYDRWVGYYKELPVADTLDQIIGMNASVGTKSINGVTVEAINKILGQFRDAAFIRLMSEEAEVTKDFLDYQLRKSEVKSGFFDQK